MVLGGITGGGIDPGTVGIDLTAHGIVGIITGITVLLVIKDTMLYGIQAGGVVDPTSTVIELI